MIMRVFEAITISFRKSHPKREKSCPKHETKKTLINNIIKIVVKNENFPKMISKSVNDLKINE